MTFHRLAAPNPVTAIAVASSGAPLPQAVIYVVDTTDFPASGTASVMTVSGLQTITYTSKAGGATPYLAGCLGGTAALVNGGAVYADLISAYFIGTPGPLLPGYDFINNPVGNGYVGLPANVNPIKPVGPNQGSYFNAFNEDAISGNQNRALYALSENSDIIDTWMHAALAIPVWADFASSGTSVTSITLTGGPGIYLGTAGDGGAPYWIDVFHIVANPSGAEEDTDILDSSAIWVVVLSVLDGATPVSPGAGYSAASTVTLSLSGSGIPAGVPYRVYYGQRMNLATLPQGALVQPFIHQAASISFLLEEYLIDLEGDPSGTWPVTWASTVYDLTHSGLDERYRRAHLRDTGSPPEPYWPALSALDTAGSGGWFYRDGPALTAYSYRGTGPTGGDPLGALFATKANDPYIVGARGTVGYAAYGLRRSGTDTTEATTTTPSVAMFMGLWPHSFTGSDTNLYTNIPAGTTVTLTSGGADATPGIVTLGTGYFNDGTHSAVSCGYDILELTWTDGTSTYYQDVVVVALHADPTKAYVRYPNGAAPDWTAGSNTGVVRWVSTSFAVGDGAAAWFAQEYSAVDPVLLDGLFYQVPPSISATSSYNSIPRTPATFSAADATSGTQALGWGGYSNTGATPGPVINSFLQGDGSIEVHTLGSYGIVSYTYTASSTAILGYGVGVNARGVAGYGNGTGPGGYFQGGTASPGVQGVGLAGGGQSGVQGSGDTTTSFGDGVGAGGYFTGGYAAPGAIGIAKTGSGQYGLVGVGDGAAYTDAYALAGGVLGLASGTGAVAGVCGRNLGIGSGGYFKGGAAAGSVDYSGTGLQAYGGNGAGTGVAQSVGGYFSGGTSTSASVGAGSGVYSAGGSGAASGSGANAGGYFIGGTGGVGIWASSANTNGTGAYAIGTGTGYGVHGVTTGSMYAIYGQATGSNTGGTGVRGEGSPATTSAGGLGGYFAGGAATSTGVGGNGVDVYGGASTAGDGGIGGYFIGGNASTVNGGVGVEGAGGSNSATGSTAGTSYGGRFLGGPNSHGLYSTGVGIGYGGYFTNDSGYAGPAAAVYGLSRSTVTGWGIEGIGSGTHPVGVLGADTAAHVAGLYSSLGGIAPTGLFGYGGIGTIGITTSDGNNIGVMGWGNSTGIGVFGQGSTDLYVLFSDVPLPSGNYGGYFRGGSGNHAERTQGATGVVAIGTGNGNGIDVQTDGTAFDSTASSGVGRPLAVNAVNGPVHVDIAAPAPGTSAPGKSNLWATNIPKAFGTILWDHTSAITTVLDSYNITLTPGVYASNPSSSQTLIAVQFLTDMADDGYCVSANYCYGLRSGNTMRLNTVTPGHASGVPDPGVPEHQCLIVLDTNYTATYDILIHFEIFGN